VEVSETDKDVCISAELPGLDEKDVEVLMGDGVLTIRGEKKSEIDDKERAFSERTYGRFERRIPLGQDVEQDHRAVKRRIRPMLGFKSMNSTRAILGGIEMVHMMSKGQAKYACNPQLSLAEQFEILAA
jgi:hypothetical protein